MPIRREDAARALNILKNCQPQLQDTSGVLNQSVEKLIEALDSDLFAALLDIHEYYEFLLLQQQRSARQNQSALPLTVRSGYSHEQSSNHNQSDSSTQSSNSNVHMAANRVTSTRTVHPRPTSNVTHLTASSPPAKTTSHNNSQVTTSSSIVTKKIVDWVQETVELTRWNTGYGFSISGGVDNPLEGEDTRVRITKLVPGGAAEASGRIQLNDIVVSVNGRSLENATHEEAVNALKQAGNFMSLVVRRETVTKLVMDQNERPAEEVDDTYGSPITPPAPEASHTSDDTSGTTLEVVFTKTPGSRGLGFSISGGLGDEIEDSEGNLLYGIYITKLTDGGMAQQDGRISVGDRLLAVNGNSLEDVTHEEAVQVLKQCGREVRLLIQKTNLGGSIVA